MDDPMDYMHQELLQRLESIRVNINWENENQRIEFPKNLCDIFGPEEIDWLLIEEAKTKGTSPFFRLPLDEILIRSGYKDEPEVDEDGKPLLRRTTALLWVAKHKLSTDNCKIKIRNLFAIYDRFDVNYTDDFGWTHFHVACKFGCEDVVEKFLEHGQDPDCRPREPNAITIDPPLHLALKHKQKKIFELLLRRAANPNLADAEGLTPLHIIGMNSSDDHDLVRILFEISEEKNQQVQLDAQDKLGWTPLHLALNFGNKKVTESLLRSGADPNLANGKGSTPLHVICKKSYENYMAMTFFRTISVIQERVNVDAQDEFGDTPLHLALRCGNKKKVQILLRSGANPNLSNKEGSTPLHVICKRLECHNDDLAKLFFKINNENRRFVQVDAVDNLDRTALQWAVANLFPNAIDVLLDNGANLSGFVFPTEIYFGEAFKPELSETSFCDFKLRLASRALAIVESLEKRGYKLDRSDAVTVMNFFANHGMFKKLADVEKSWYDDENFARELKNITIEDNDISTSLYALIRSRRVQSELAYADYLKLAHSKKLEYLSDQRHRKACISLLCEIMLRRFCRKWAASSMCKVTRSRMPLHCCESVTKHLENKDLWHICLVARGPRS